MRLHPLALALAGGILWAGGILFFSVLAQFCTYAEDVVQLVAKFYIGFESTLAGTLIGMAWGFADAFIGLYILAWLYNFLLGKLSAKG